MVPSLGRPPRAGEVQVSVVGHGFEFDAGMATARLPDRWGGPLHESVDHRDHDATPQGVRAA